jgi:UDP:flavonoid glycosyltransferase YjiC (YdhE family)
MRILCSSTQGTSHFTALVPVAHACRRRGHEVKVAGPPQLAEAVEAAGLPFWEFSDPPRDELDAVWSRVPSLSPDEANKTVIQQIFGELDTSAALVGLRRACEEWRPDVVLRDPNEYGSALAAELHGIPAARVAIGLGAMEELSLRIVAETLDELRESIGLEPDPGTERIRRTPCFSAFPVSLERTDLPQQADTRRFRDPAWDAPAAELPDWWPGNDDPLVYVTFGTVAGTAETAAQLFAGAIEAVSGLPVRMLLTVGRAFDPAALDASANVRVEQWVPQADALAQASAVVCHGGSGTVLGTLAAGLPLVVTPLFADQPQNAERVAAVGAGVAVRPPTPKEVRKELRRVLTKRSYRDAAERLAAELRSQPPVDSVVDALEELAVSERRPADAPPRERPS